MGTERRFSDADLARIRDEILPQCTSMRDAHRAIAEQLGKEIGTSYLRDSFKRAFDVPPSKFLGRPEAVQFNPDNELSAARQQVEKADGYIADLEKQLELANKEAFAMRSLKELLGACGRPANPPRWITAEYRKHKLFHGVPLLQISDLHWGEVVNPAEVNGCNIYNLDVARKRLRRTVDKTIFLLDSVFQNPEYPGIVVPHLGDIVSGNIHEELRETNAAPIFDICLDAVDHICAGIQLLANRFTNVYVPWVVGNHGRLDRKPRAKRGPHDNFEYMIGHMVARHFASNDNVVVRVSDSFTDHFRIFGTRYLMTHGDSFRGGKGISGPILPWTLGDHRLRKQMQTMSAWTKNPTEYDVLIFGHWHTYFPARTFVSNGSLKGFDEYAKREGFTFEPPQQALWITNPDYGMTFNTSVFAEDPPKAANDTQWVSWKAA